MISMTVNTKIRNAERRMKRGAQYGVLPCRVDSQCFTYATTLINGMRIATTTHATVIGESGSRVTISNVPVISFVISSPLANVRPLPEPR